jgi:hypothetical protein
MLKRVRILTILAVAAIPLALGARRPREGRGVIAQDFGFHVNSAAYKLRN